VAEDVLDEERAARPQHAVDLADGGGNVGEVVRRDPAGDRLEVAMEFRCFALAGVGLLAGCDVGAAVVAITRQARDKDDDDAPPVAAAVPSPPPVVQVASGDYRVWVAQLAPGQAPGERDAIAARGGEPDPAVWTSVGHGAATGLFDPEPSAGSVNAVLVEVTEARVYEMDALEILDASGTVTEVAPGPVYADRVTAPENLLGAPDGVTAATGASAGSRAFAFCVFSGSIDRFRVSLWSGPRAPGDVRWVARWTNPGDETPGGGAVDGAGTIFLTVSDWTGAAARDIRLLRVDDGGAVLGTTLVEAGVSTAAGSHSAALDGAGNLYVASMGGSDDFRVRKLDGALVEQWVRTFGTALLDDRVEARALTVDAAGSPIVAGGLSTLATAIDHWLGKLSPVDGSTVWTQVLAVSDVSPTYWFAAAADGAGQIYTAGDLTNLATGYVEDFARKTSSAGAMVWSAQLGDSDAPADRAQAVAVDAGSNVIVGGFFGTTSQGRDGALIKYTSAGSLVWSSTANGRDGLDDEIADVAVDSGGNIYATGFETVSGQGKNLWVRKYGPAGNVVWTRTYHGGVGDDRAVGVSVSGSWLVVLGVETVSGGTTDVHIRAYAR
jgi:hypothetical protein